MKTLENALESYFGTRRALGFRLDQSERLLRHHLRNSVPHVPGGHFPICRL